MIIKTQTKETVWYERLYEVPNGTSVSKIIEQIDNGLLESIEGEYLLDTSVNMTPEQNDGYSVFEMFKLKKAGEEMKYILIYKDGK